MTLMCETWQIIVFDLLLYLLHSLVQICEFTSVTSCSLLCSSSLVSSEELSTKEYRYI